MTITTSFVVRFSSGASIQCYASASLAGCIDSSSLAFWAAAHYMERNFKEVELDYSSFSIVEGRDPSAVWLGELV